MNLAHTLSMHHHPHIGFVHVTCRLLASAGDTECKTLVDSQAEQSNIKPLNQCCKHFHMLVADRVGYNVEPNAMCWEALQVSVPLQNVDQVGVERQDSQRGSYNLYSTEKRT